MTEPIVAFSRPPVVEVSAGVAFDDLGPVGSALTAGFWRDVAREEFPLIQLQPPYKPVIEHPSGDQPPFPRFTMLQGMPSPRIWASGDDGQHLLQLQSDWFACNWRRVRPQDKYDRWPSRRTEFASWFSKLREYADASGTPISEPRQCEVTYINHISPGGPFRSHRDFARVFTVSLGVGPLEPEQLSFDIKYALGDGEMPVGRLHANAVPGFDSERRPVFVFQLTARGWPQNGDLLAFLDRGREVIDRTFIALTTADMQEGWGRTQ